MDDNRDCVICVMCGVEWIAVEDVIARFEKIRA